MSGMSARLSLATSVFAMAAHRLILFSVHWNESTTLGRESFTVLFDEHWITAVRVVAYPAHAVMKG